MNFIHFKVISVPVVVTFTECYINVIKEYLVFRAWSLSHTITYLRFVILLNIIVGYSCTLYKEYWAVLCGIVIPQLFSPFISWWGQLNFIKSFPVNCKAQQALKIITTENLKYKYYFISYQMFSHGSEIILLLYLTWYMWKKLEWPATGLYTTLAGIRGNFGSCLLNR